MAAIDQNLDDESCHPASPRALFLFFLALLGLGLAGAQASWGAAHALLFTGAGILMVVFPPVVALPRTWLILAGLFVVCLGGAFVPDAWLAPIAWRDHLRAMGLETGTLATPHPRAAAEMAMTLIARLGVGLWIVGHRPSARGLRLTATGFATGVAAAALLSMVFPALALNVHGDQAYGFFPNRNHNALLLAMGAIVALGSLTQGMREQRAGSISLAAFAAVVCIWGVLGWSVSRAGVVLLVIAVMLWIALLGPRYFGKHSRRAVLLLMAAAAGGFLIAEPTVKQRLRATIQRTVRHDDSAAMQDLDFRVLTWLDTATMIRQRPWTGFGPGQFTVVFPQYRQRTTGAQRAQQIHPESDWMWLAAESGLPAAAALAALIGAAGLAGMRGIQSGHLRAVRASCLVAALLVACHSLIDVPGHRVPLAWAAALLLGVSLRGHSCGNRRPNRWLARAGGLGVLALGIWMGAMEKFSVHGLAYTAGERAVLSAVAISQANRQAQAKGQPPQSREGVRTALADALALAPMDSRLHYFAGAFALTRREDDDNSAARRAFAFERLLEPTSLVVPLRQASTWAPLSSREAADLCRATRLQASAFDRSGTPPPIGTPSWTAAAEAQILTLARHFPNLALRLGIELPKRRR